MILEKLSLHNFAIYKGLQEFDLRTNDIKKPIILIGAMNGSGKTTFLHSIDFVLYGKNSNVFKSQNLSYEKFLEKNIHKDQIDEGAQITLEFNRVSKGESQLFRVIRSWKKSGDKIKESFSVYINDWFDELITKDWDNFIEQILPSKVAQLFFFDGEKIESMADLEQSKDVLKKSIDSLLGLEIVTRLESDLDDFRKKSALLVKDDEERKIINELSKEVEIVNAQIKEIEEQKTKIEDKIILNKHDISNIEQELEKSGLDFFTKRQDFERELLEKQDTLSSLDKDFLTMVSSEYPLLLVEDQIKDLQKRFLLDSQQNKQEETIEATNNLIKEFNEFVDKNCNDASFQDKAKKHFDTKIIINEKNHQSFASIVGMDDFLFKNLLDQVFPSQKNNLKEKIQLYNNLEEEVELLKSKIKKIPAEDIIKPLVEKQNVLKKDSIGLQAQLNQLDMQIGSKRFEKQPKEIQLRKLYQIETEKQTELLDAQRFVIYSEKTKTIMENFKQKVLQHHIKKLENEIAICFNILIRKDGFLQKVQIDLNSFELLLFDKKDRVIETSQLSAGERQLLAVSILWALARASNKSSPTIIDTPLGRLDSKHRLNLIEKYFPQASHQVILLSTDEEINENYHQKLKNSVSRSYLINFDTKHNGSKVEEGYFFNA